MRRHCIWAVKEEEPGETLKCCRSRNTMELGTEVLSLSGVCRWGPHWGMWMGQPGARYRSGVGESKDE